MIKIITSSLLMLFILFGVYGQEESKVLIKQDTLIVIDQSDNSQVQISGGEVLIVGKDSDSTRISMSDSIRVINKPEKTVVKIGKDEILVVEENKDTTRIKFGSRGITIVEGPDGTTVDLNRFNKETEELSAKDNDQGDDAVAKPKSKFKPHWAGFEWGINNYVNSDFSMNLDPESSFMDLRTSRSWNFNLNILEYGIGLGTNKLGLVTGMGLEFNNYHFTGNNNITYDNEGVIVGYLPSFALDPATDIRKTKFQSAYLVAPLLLEGQIPTGSSSIFISAGIIGGVKIGSKTKMVYEVNGNRQKDKIKDDFNLSLFRYGFTARVGYKMLKLFGTYYPTSLFIKDDGPELYPFSIGLTLVSF